MKLLHRWLKPGTPPTSEIEEPKAVPVGVGVRPQFERSREYSEDSTFSWFGVDHADSSIFESEDVCPKDAQTGSVASTNILKPLARPAYITDDNEGFDPYNTGHFEASKK